MGNVISLQAHKEKQLAQAHAKALVLFECAATLARRGDPALVALVEEAFGADFLEKRVCETLRPARKSAPKRAPSRR